MSSEQDPKWGRVIRQAESIREPDGTRKTYDGTLKGVSELFADLLDKLGCPDQAATARQCVRRRYLEVSRFKGLKGVVEECLTDITGGKKSIELCSLPDANSVLWFHFIKNGVLVIHITSDEHQRYLNGT